MIVACPAPSTKISPQRTLKNLSTSGNTYSRLIHAFINALIMRIFLKEKEYSRLIGGIICV